MSNEPTVKRWTAKRKAAVVMNIFKGKTIAAEVARQHDLTVSEVAGWIEEAQRSMENRFRARELASSNIQQPALFLGDSKYDYQAASAAGLDFLFLSGGSEVADWHDWTEVKGINSYQSVDDLVG